ncbi:MAG: hypothetical protein JWP99_278 [Devosia sp.]|nr:hypothetical protein [Devosia sp.]
MVDGMMEPKHALAIFHMERQCMRVRSAGCGRLVASLIRQSQQARFHVEPGGAQLRLLFAPFQQHLHDAQLAAGECAFKVLRLIELAIDKGDPV